MKIDKRTRQYKRTRKVLRQALLLLLAILAITAAVAYIRLEPNVPVSPKGQARDSSASLSTLVLAAEEGVQAPSEVVITKIETREIPRPVTIEEKVKYAWGAEGDRAWKLVTECENKSVNPRAVNHNSNGTWDAGLFQINQVHGYSMEHLFDVDNNIRAAYKIYQSRGWTAWSCAWVIGETPFYE